ncbi:MAG: glycosyltransferase [Anaerolineales bacterium]|nr:glycosyltransferase [Anaerolineales bacterium]
MRILCLTARLPYPPNRGDRLRAYNFIKSLSRQHELHLLSFIASPAEREYLPPLQELCQTVQVVQKTPLQSALTTALNLWRSEPLQALYYRSAAMQRLVDSTLTAQEFKAIYIHLFRMAPYVEHHATHYRILDLTDVISREISLSLPYRGLLSRLLYRIEGPRIRRYEIHTADHFEETWLIAEADRALLAKSCPHANIRIITNGIDSAHFYPTGQPRSEARILFTGHMGVPHNIDAACILAQRILPLVQQHIPHATLRLVGADPSPAVLALQSKSTSVTGFVPDLNRELNQAAIFAAPLRFAAGVQNKVLEAMAAACPVITTSIVNEGIRATAGHELFIANTAEETASQLVLLLQEPLLRQTVGQAAARFVKLHFSWDVVLHRLAEIEVNLNRNNTHTAQRSRP